MPPAPTEWAPDASSPLLRHFRMHSMHAVRPRDAVASASRTAVLNRVVGDAGASPSLAAAGGAWTTAWVGSWGTSLSPPSWRTSPWQASSAGFLTPSSPSGYENFLAASEMSCNWLVFLVFISMRTSGLVAPNCIKPFYLLLAIVDAWR